MKMIISFVGSFSITVVMSLAASHTGSSLQFCLFSFTGASNLPAMLSDSLSEGKSELLEAWS